HERQIDREAPLRQLPAKRPAFRRHARLLGALGWAGSGPNDELPVCFDGIDVATVAIRPTVEIEPEPSVRWCARGVVAPGLERNGGTCGRRRWERGRHRAPTEEVVVPEHPLSLGQALLDRKAFETTNVRGPALAHDGVADRRSGHLQNLLGGFASHAPGGQLDVGHPSPGRKNNLTGEIDQSVAASAEVATED